jgi:hypothetical protein
MRSLIFLLLILLECRLAAWRTISGFLGVLGGLGGSVINLVFLGGPGVLAVQFSVSHAAAGQRPI